MILGIDVSTKSIGYAFINNGKLIEYGKVPFGAGEQHTRFLNGAVALKKFATMYDYTTLVIEEPPYVNNKAVFGSLTMFYGLIVGSLYKPGIKIITPKPLMWQREIGNALLTTQEKRYIMASNPNHAKNWYSEYGRKMRKQRTADWVHSQFGIVIGDDDVTDAIGIAYYGHINDNKTRKISST